MTTDRPRSLAAESEKARRVKLLTLPHIAPLATYVEALRRRGLGDVPDFDPLDGGTLAQVLFLFEKPSREAASSRFISRNNDDPTAENTFKFMEQAGISRKLTCTWNVIPGWNGSAKVTSDELRFGVACLHELVDLLPNLKAVMLVGQKAERARHLLEGRGVPVLSSYHPSRKNYAFAREKWLAIPSQWAQVRPYLA